MPVVPFTSIGGRIVDIALRVDPQLILNDGPPEEGPSNPAQAMMEASKMLLAEAIDPESGDVNYPSVATGSAYQEYQRLTRSLLLCQATDIPPGEGGKAFWINLYNALIIDAVIRYNVQGSLARNPGFFRKAAYDVGGLRYSADDIEHGILRGNRRHPFLPFQQFGPGDPRLGMKIEPVDPRIHFSLVCGARSCPPIRYYKPAQLDEQLDQATSVFINGGGVQIDSTGTILRVSRIFKWYQRDFNGRAGVLQLIGRYTQDEVVQNLLDMNDLRIRYDPYDWSLNII